MSAEMALVFLASNDERELSAAFLRRCLVPELSRRTSSGGWRLQRSTSDHPSAARSEDDSEIDI
ncbi:MAG: hypothetical protein ABSB35_23345 [Bryobacteraceae bacterium]